MITENIEIQNKEDLILNYRTYGCAKDEAPSVLILHALTGNSNVTGPSGWWKEIVGIGKAIDLEKFHVVAIDIPGNGTNEQCIEEIELYDAYLIAGIIVEELTEAGYTDFDYALGGSLGGGLLWEILVDAPNWIKKAFIIAAHYETTPWLKGITSIQNELLKNSIRPIEDARKMAMLFYRSTEGFANKFSNPSAAVSWLNYHGRALKERFSIEAYRFMNHLLGSINAVDGYTGIDRALKGITTEIILVGIDSDLLFPAADIRRTHEELKQYNTHYHEIESVHGHDAFLIEFEQLENIINQYITTK